MKRMHVCISFRQNHRRATKVGKDNGKNKKIKTKREKGTEA